LNSRCGRAPFNGDRKAKEQQGGNMKILCLLFVLAAPQAVTLDIKDGDLGEFLRMMGSLSDLNVVLHPAVQGKISLTVRDANRDALLNQVLKNYGLGREIEGNVMRIAPLPILEDEYKARAAMEAARFESLPMETRVYFLNYTKAIEVAPMLAPLLSPRATVIAEPRRNMIIVRDVAR
jgi:type II secretory pathway component GspD/PulD (secretin)